MSGLNVGLLVVFVLAFALWLYFAIAKGIVYGQAVREGADRDRWVSDLRARQLDQICNEQEVRVIAPGKVGRLVSTGEGDSHLRNGFSAPAHHEAQP